MSPPARAATTRFVAHRRSQSVVSRAPGTTRHAAPVPRPCGGDLDLEKFRYREWTPALRAAGIDHRRLYDLRHTYATWRLDAGIGLFTLSRRMGTSLAMIDATYGHLAPDARGERALLDAWDAREARAAGD